MAPKEVRIVVGNGVHTAVCNEKPKGKATRLQVKPERAAGKATIPKATAPRVTASKEAHVRPKASVGGGTARVKPDGIGSKVEKVTGATTSGVRVAATSPSALVGSVDLLEPARAFWSMWFGWWRWWYAR